MLRIKYELDRLGLRQKDLAERTGLKHQAVSRIINGQEPAWPKRGKRIAQAIGWEGDPAELFEPVEIEVQDGVMNRPYEGDGTYYTEDGREPADGGVKPTKQPNMGVEQLPTSGDGKGTKTLRSKMEKRDIPYTAYDARYTVITAENNHGHMMRFNEYEAAGRPKIMIEITGLSPTLAVEITSMMRQLLTHKSHKPTIEDAIEILRQIELD